MNHCDRPITLGEVEEFQKGLRGVVCAYGGAVLSCDGSGGYMGPLIE
jgi:hypothetical protein